MDMGQVKVYWGWLGQEEIFYWWGWIGEVYFGSKEVGADDWDGHLFQYNPMFSTKSIIMHR